MRVSLFFFFFFLFFAIGCYLHTPSQKHTTHTQQK